MFVVEGYFAVQICYFLLIENSSVFFIVVGQPLSAAVSLNVFELKIFVSHKEASIIHSKTIQFTKKNQVFRVNFDKGAKMTVDGEVLTSDAKRVEPYLVKSVMEIFT